MRSPDPLAAMGDTFKGSEGRARREGKSLLIRRGRKRRGPTCKGDGRERREERGEGKGGQENSPQSQGE